jgi:hypothetical protein
MTASAEGMADLWKCPECCGDTRMNEHLSDCPFWLAFEAAEWTTEANGARDVWDAAYRAIEKEISALSEKYDLAMRRIEAEMGHAAAAEQERDELRAELEIRDALACFWKKKFADAETRIAEHDRNVDARGIPSFCYRIAEK